MSQAPRPAEDRRDPASEAEKQSYHAPELRELGRLDDLTRTGGEGGDEFDSGPNEPLDYAS